jgi:hypothetical protein
LVDISGAGRATTDAVRDKSENRETISPRNVAVRNEVSHEIIEQNHTPIGAANAHCRRVLQNGWDWALDLL